MLNSLFSKSSILRREDYTYFEMLKKAMVLTMRQSHPWISSDISQWKGQEITDFQEDMLLRSKGQVSEKWFYSHLKGNNDKLPRIDVLNLLSKYAGYSGWDDFKFKSPGGLHRQAALMRTNRIYFFIPVVALAILLLFYGIYRLIGVRDYTVYFYDSDTKDPILLQDIEVTILSDEESPVSNFCDTAGCFSLRTDQSMIRMVVKSPYYLTDTIIRVLKKFRSDEHIGLRVNHYAVMIRYFSGMRVEDWKRHRDQLDKIFDDQAVIYQVHGGTGNPGMVLYNKQEFINLLSIPTSTLRQLEVIDTRYFKDRIMLLKFRTQTLNQ